MPRNITLTLFVINFLSLVPLISIAKEDLIDPDSHSTETRTIQPGDTENNSTITRPPDGEKDQTGTRAWSEFFDDTLNDMQEEQQIAQEEHKKGILLMFEMDECPFCKRMKRTVLNQTKVQDFYHQNFRIISVDIEGDLELTDFSGKLTTQKDFSLKQFRVRATPVFQFLDTHGKKIKNGRLTGATKDAEEFLLFGKYITEGKNKKMSFSRYKRSPKQAQ